MRSINLQAKIVIYTVGVVATLIILFSFINLLLDYKSTREHIQEHVIELARSISDTVQGDLYFNRRYNLRRIARTFSGYRAIREIAIIDANGIVISDQDTPGSEDFIANLHIPSDAKEVEGTRIWRGKHIVNVLVPVLGEADQPLGFLYISKDNRDEEAALLKKLSRGLILSGLVGILGSMVGFLAGNRLSGSLIALTRAANDLADGREIKPLPVTSNDELGQLTQTFNDMVKSRKKAEASLERSRQHLLFVLNETSLGYIEWTLDFKVGKWNKAAERIFGYSQKEALGRHALKLIVPEELHDNVEKIWFHVLAQTGGYASVNENIRADKTRITCQWNNTVIRDSEGEITAVASLVDDITESIEAQANMRQAMEAAQQATRAKSDFLANMSHEIRTPMNGVIGLTDLLLESELLPEQRNYVEIIRGSGEMLLTILNDILDLSKIESGKLDLSERVFDLEECLGSAFHLFSRDLNAKSLAKSLELDPSLPRYVKGDPVRLRQIIYNIIGNAVKFTDQGSIILKAHGEETENGIIRIHVTIKDSGCGIDPNHVDHIFEPFSQADYSPTRVHGGTGLGLTICKRLCKLMGGDIWIESTSSEGTDFVFKVDLKQVAPEEIPDKRTTPRDKVTARRNQELFRILVAEDNAVNRLVTRRILKRLGFDCTTVENGLKAVEQMDRSPFDLVFMDVQMPVMDGLTATREIKRKHGSAVHIVALTAAAIEEDRERCRKAGMDDYLAKPIDLSSVSEIIRKVERLKSRQTHG